MSEVQKSKQQLFPVGLYLGCDPELFFERNGAIIGAERVLPETGFLPVSERLGEKTSSMYDTPKGIILDGVQLELNPKPGRCRQQMGKKIQYSMAVLKKRLEDLGDKEIKVCFKPVVKLRRSELDTLSDKAKVFGCAPSLNIYDEGAKVGVDASKYLRRSAGGHIHLGLQGEGDVMKHRERLVVLLDIMLGIPSVMMDRCPEAHIRRKYYGRAGEYRLPKHGLEYRVLSNFWLWSYPLMSLVMAQARNAACVLNTGFVKQPPYPATYRGSTVYTQEWWNKSYPPEVYWDAEADLLKRVDVKAVREAINKNDLDLALKCWQGVKEFIAEHMTSWPHGIGSHNIEAFEFFCQKIWDGGLEYWFPEDPMKHWLEYTEIKNGPEDSYGMGWEDFVKVKVVPIMMEARKNEPAAIGS